MPRKRIILHDTYPYHIQSRSNNREFFSVPLNVLWLIFIENFYVLKIKYGCHIHAFVLMSNHYHLIISTPFANIADVMEYLNREVAKAANKYANRINHFFGGPYQWSLISDDLYYWNSVKYTFRNPVKAGICENVEDYKFSSLTNKVEDGFWSLDSELNGLDKINYLNWFNENFDDEKELAIRKALRRREFKLPRDKNSFVVSLDAPLRKKVRSTD